MRQRDVAMDTSVINAADHQRGVGSSLSRRAFVKGAGATLAAAGLIGVGAGSEQTRQVQVAAGQGAKGSSNMPWVEVEPGVQLYVQDWGEGKTIVLVHGWPSSQAIFEYQSLTLAQRGYRVVSIDQRGFGASDKPWHGNDYDTWADDLGKVLQKLDLQDVALAGYSMGGAVAMHYAATRRDRRVTKLVLLAAAGPALVEGPDYPHGLPREMFEGIIQGVIADRAAFFHDFIPNLFHTPVSPAYAAWFERLVLAASPWATLRGAEEGRDRDLRSELGSISIPTRIMHGVHDFVVPFQLAEAEQRRLIPGATLVPFENSGHGLFVDERDKLVDELAAFAG